MPHSDSPLRMPSVGEQVLERIRAFRHAAAAELARSARPDDERIDLRAACLAVRAHVSVDRVAQALARLPHVAARVDAETYATRVARTARDTERLRLLRRHARRLGPSEPAALPSCRERGALRAAVGGLLDEGVQPAEAHDALVALLADAGRPTDFARELVLDCALDPARAAPRQLVDLPTVVPFAVEE